MTPHRHPVRALLPTLLLLTSAVIVVLVVFWGRREMQFQRTRIQVEQAAARLADPAGDAEILARLSRAQRDVAAFVQPSVVHLECRSESGRGPHPSLQSTGSGWIWDANGHIVTAWHVVRGMDEIEVQMHDGSRRSAALISSDPLTDVAVLGFDSTRTIAATRSDIAAHQGDLVFAFGSPLDFRFSVSSGVVSGLGRDTRDTSALPHAAFENFIQIDAPINPGSSGGPITDHRGHVIGMSTAIAARAQSASEDHFSGVALAVPMDMIEAVVPQLLSGGKVRRGYLGVGILDTHRPVSAMIGPVPMEGGVLLSWVDPQCGLAADGLRSGDVIWNISDQPATVEGMNDWLRSGEGEVSLTATHLLDGDPYEPRTVTASSPLHHGATVTALSSRLHTALLGEGAPPAGVVVSSPVDGGPAAEAGMRRGDIITSIDGRSTGSVDQLRAIVSSLPPQTTVSVSLWRPDLTRGTGHAHNVQVTLADRSERFDP